MRRTSASAVAALIAFAAIVAFAFEGSGKAHAAPSVDRQAWTRTGAAAPPAPQSGNIYVAAAGGAEQARAFVHVDVAGLDEEHIAGMTVVLTPGSDAVLADQAALVACPLTTMLTASGEITADAPQADCSTHADLSRGDNGSWSLPLAPYAHAWTAGGNNGVAIVPSPAAAATPFSVSFDTARTALNGASPTAPGDASGAAAPTDSSSTPSAVPSAPSEPAATPASSFDTPPSDAATATATPSPTIAPSPAVASPPAKANQSPTETGGTGAPVAGGRGAAHPSGLLVVVPVLIAAALLAARSQWGPARVWRVGAWALLPVVVMTFGETTIYKLGLVAIAFVAAIGLHLLVNWTGELSLAHAGFIGVPAFIVAQISAHSGLSPVLALPVAVIVGVALGSIVGVAALRSRGLQVALVTLAVGIAIGQFLFFRSWLVGPIGGLRIPVPTLFGLQLRTSRSMVPLLTVVVLLSIVVARSIMSSKVGRALLLVRSDPDAAAAAGVAVARHRALAYGIAGGFAGVAGWSYVVWVQQVTAKAFPLQLGFTYLVIAALAGAGGLGGVVAAATLIEGGALFSILPHWFALYAAPVGLIVNVTRYQAGFNGLLRVTRKAFGSMKGDTMEKHKVRVPIELRPLVVAGTLAMVAGFAAIGLAWYHMGNTDAVWVQNQELMSGGVVGLGLIIVGATLLMRDSIVAARVAGRPPSVEHTAVEPASGPAPSVDATGEIALTFAPATHGGAQESAEVGT